MTKPTVRIVHWTEWPTDQIDAMIKHYKKQIEDMVEALARVEVGEEERGHILDSIDDAIDGLITWGYRLGVRTGRGDDDSGVRWDS
jgi:hypothetical protein